MTEKLKILVADDHPLFRAGVVQTLTQLPGIEIDEAKEGNEALKRVIEQEPDIAILDLKMPGKTGLEILAELNEANIPVKTILLTMYKNTMYFYQAVSLGAKGYLLKETAVDDLLTAIKEVSEGRVFISNRLKNLIHTGKKDEFRNKLRIEAINSLTNSEKEIMKLLAEWKTSNEIADLLSNSVRTIENHRARISEKLSIRGAHSLIRFAIENKELF